jgi:predicted aspartyl protease
MRIDGEWQETEDTLPRPFVHGRVEAHDGTWIACMFLIDTGADQTVLAPDLVRQLGRPTTPAPRQLGGIGGAVETLEVWTTLRLTTTAGNNVNLSATYATLSDAAIEESILGYDVLHLFALIVDRPGNTVCLIRPPHQYTIQHG